MKKLDKLLEDRSKLFSEIILKQKELHKKYYLCKDIELIYEIERNIEVSYYRLQLIGSEIKKLIKNM